MNRRTRNQDRARASASVLSAADFAREVLHHRIAIGFSLNGVGPLEILFHRSIEEQDEERILLGFNAHQAAIGTLCESLELHASLDRPGSLGLDSYIEADDERVITKAPNLRAAPSNTSFAELAEMIHRRKIALGLKQLHDDRAATFEIVTHDDDSEVTPDEAKFWAAFGPHAETVLRLHAVFVRYRAIKQFVDGVV